MQQICSGCLWRQVYRCQEALVLLPRRRLFPQTQLIGICIGSSRNATSHLQSLHNSVAVKTEAHQRTLVDIKKHIESADVHFHQDPQRWFQINIAAFACKNSPAFRAFDSPTWKLIADKLPVGSGKGLQPINIRKHYVEHYATIRQQITNSIKEAKSFYAIPFLSVSLDLIQNSVQNKKLIGLRASYAYGTSLRSWNLAVHGYNPTADQVAGDRASDLLVD